MLKHKRIFAQRALAFFLMLSLCAFFCGCGKSEAAQAVDDQIAAIGEITLESEQKIVDAESAVELLPEKEKKQLENLDQLNQMRKDYEELVKKAEQEKIAAEQEKLHAEILKVETAISQIGTVKLDERSKNAIESARRKYNASTSEVQKGVTNLSVLEEAEAKLVDLQAEKAIQMIEDIGEVTLESGDKIKAAEKYVDSIPNKVTTKISNLQALRDARAKYQTMKKEYALSLLGTFRVEEDPVQRVKFYSSKMEPRYANERSYVFPYIGMGEYNSIWLCVKLHYTGDDWIFFDKITFAIDDERIIKTYKYSELERDNGHGDVWEYVHIIDNGYEDLFWKIANSKKTIVRFEGDAHYFDLTVSDADKQAIRELLTAFDALIDAGYRKI